MTALHTSAQTALTTQSAGEHQHHLRFPKEKNDMKYFGLVLLKSLSWGKKNPSS